MGVDMDRASAQAATQTTDMCTDVECCFNFSLCHAAPFKLGVWAYSARLPANTRATHKHAQVYHPAHALMDAEINRHAVAQHGHTPWHGRTFWSDASFGWSLIVVASSWDDVETPL